ncbi:hypothetical protein Daus18300_004295 [Diaporthe australafricana]|uniref:F-box domain-containing protein n=1 Tax=Diaporthe australafricana TaxID=127596 RepID=A0ABR3XAU4_9PEZI
MADTSITTTSWGYLPREIRLMILEELFDDGCSVAAFATVSREWQANIERHLFARITLDFGRAAQFGAAVAHRNRGLVRAVVLRVGLRDYAREVRAPMLFADALRLALKRTFISLSVRDVLGALRAWGRRREVLFMVL